MIQGRQIIFTQSQKYIFTYILQLYKFILKNEVNKYCHRGVFFKYLHNNLVTINLVI